ncbi:MAG: homoserine O-succinyltransferase, partial [Methylovirgula sp.]|nr:homoserine O-succinyltransferase [Methylovirgula sp.]
MGGAPESRSRGADGSAAAKCLEIGIVNNMPDASLLATERQFKDLIVQAAGAPPARLRF